jgi:hypothetical protein
MALEPYRREIAMVRSFVRIGIVTLALGATGVVQAGPSGADVVGPAQRFVGLVNADHSGAVIYVACAGPIYEGRTGPAVSGQSVAALLLPGGALPSGGSTGAASRLVIAFPDSSVAATMNLRRYGVAKLLPSTLQLPCGGTGTVTFTPAPASATSVPDTVAVTYENIAV